MIIYGTRAATLESFSLENEVCQNCDAKGSLVLTFYRKHAHIFWIPMFPIGKGGFSVCSNCKSTLEKKEMPESLRMEFQVLKNNVKGPLWQFSGLVLAAVLVALVATSIRSDNKREAEVLATPQVGDVYNHQLAKNGYSTLKVVEVSDDSVFVVANMYYSNKIMGVRKIEKPENYSDSAYGISKAQLLKMHSDGDIYSARRAK